MSGKDKKAPILQVLYGEDSPTQLLHPRAKEKRAKENTKAQAMPIKQEAHVKETTTADAVPLRDRIARALERKSKTDVGDTSSMKARRSSTDKPGQSQRGKQSIPENPVQDSALGSFNHSYVLERLNQGIAEAQERCEYDEAIRLQELCFKLQDQEISPIQAAREAWFRPLVKTENAKT